MMNESIGATLRQAREQRHLSLQQVAEKTKIRSHYLQALESGDFTVMPSAAQARGFLRIYADFLGLDVSQLMPSGPAVDSGAITSASSGLAPVEHQDPAPAPTPRISRPSFWNILRERWLRRGGGESPSEPVVDDPDEAKKKALN